MDLKLYIILFLIKKSNQFLVDEPTVQLLSNEVTKLKVDNLALTSELTSLKNRVSRLEDCAADICEIHWRMWSEWTVWSNCAGQCTGGYSTRHQTRTRTRVCNIKDTQGQLCHGDTSQNETRPCSSVELHGCLNPHNAKDNRDPYAYGVAYNFMDELAQSTCAALLTTSSHVAAIRRDCYSGQAAQCSTICRNNGYACVDELHVYIPGTVLNPNKTEESHVGLSMYRYFSCTFGDGHCGPNYCCCTWP